jgi:hypothetical protein
MKLAEILSEINPVLRILLIVVLTVAAHFFVKAIRRFSQYLLTMKVDSDATSEASLTRQIPQDCHHHYHLGQCRDLYDLFRGRRYGSARI